MSAPFRFVGWHAQFEFKAEDCWIGVFWRRTGNCIDAWICVFPCIPLHISWWWSREPNSGGGEVSALPLGHAHYSPPDQRGACIWCVGSGHPSHPSNRGDCTPCGRPRADHEPAPVVPRPPQSDCLDRINAAVLREREACAQVAEAHRVNIGARSPRLPEYSVAAAIRARGGHRS